MKYFVALFLILTPTFGYQTGKSSLGAQLGFSTSEFELDYGSTAPGTQATGDLSGFSFELSGNFNVFNNNTNTFGVDLFSRFTGSPALNDKINGTEIDTGIFNINASVRPYFRTGIFSPYAIIGLSHFSFEVEEEGFSGWRKGTKISPTLGFGASLEFTDSLVFSPSFVWSKVDMPSISDPSISVDFGSTNSFRFDFPLTYAVTDHFSIGATLSHTNFSDVDKSTVNVTGLGPVSLAQPIGFSYWITSFMIKGDIVF